MSLLSLGKRRGIINAKPKVCRREKTQIYNTYRAGFIVVTDIVLSPIFTESGYIKSDIAVTDLFLLLTVLQP